MQRLVINFVGFQLGWFACVYGGAHGMPWLGILFAIPVIAWHLSQANNWRNEAILLTLAVFIGPILDQSLLSFGLSVFPQHDISTLLLPSWMYALWLLFAVTLNISLRWMRGKTLIAVLFGAIGGPLAYLGASKLGAISFTHLEISMLMLSIGWAIMTPLMLKLSIKFDGYSNDYKESVTGETHV